MKTIGKMAFLAMIFAGYVQPAHADPSPVPTSSNEDELLLGAVAPNGDRKNISCVEISGAGLNYAGDQSEVARSNSVSTDFQFEVVNSMAVLDHDLDGDVEAKADFVFGSVKGGLSYLNQVDQTSTETNLVLEVMVESGATRVDQNRLEAHSKKYVLTGDARHILDGKPGSLQRFYDACGTRFITGTRRKLQFGVLYALKTTTESDRESLGATLDYSGSWMDLKSKIQDVTNKASKNSSLKVRLVSSGTGAQFAQQMNKVLANATNLDALLGTTDPSAGAIGGVLGDAISAVISRGEGFVDSVETADYATFPEVNDEISAEAVAANWNEVRQVRLKDLSSEWVSVDDHYSKLRRYDSMSAGSDPWVAFDDATLGKLRGLEQSWLAFVNQVKARGEACLQAQIATITADCRTDDLLGHEPDQWLPSLPKQNLYGHWKVGYTVTPGGAVGFVAVPVDASGALETQFLRSYSTQGQLTTRRDGYIVFNYFTDDHQSLGEYKVVGEDTEINDPITGMTEPKLCVGDDATCLFRVVDLDATAPDGGPLANLQIKVLEDHGLGDRHCNASGCASDTITFENDPISVGPSPTDSDLHWLN